MELLTEYPGIILINLSIIQGCLKSKLTRSLFNFPDICMILHYLKKLYRNFQMSISFVMVQLFGKTFLLILVHINILIREKSKSPVYLVNFWKNMIMYMLISPEKAD